MEDRREETGRVGKGQRGRRGCGLRSGSAAEPGQAWHAASLSSAGQPSKTLALLLYSMFVRVRDSLYERDSRSQKVLYDLRN